MSYRKFFKIKYSNNRTKEYSKIISGTLGLKVLSNFNLESPQLNSVVKSIKRIIRKKNFLIINSVPFFSLTRKPRDVRMGRGKGAPTTKIFPLRAGKIILELRNVDKNLAKRALKSASIKLSKKSKIVTLNDKRTDSLKGSW